MATINIFAFPRELLEVTAEVAEKFRLSAVGVWLFPKEVRQLPSLRLRNLDGKMPEWIALDDGPIDHADPLKALHARKSGVVIQIGRQTETELRLSNLSTNGKKKKWRNALFDIVTSRSNAGLWVRSEITGGSRFVDEVRYMPSVVGVLPGKLRLMEFVGTNEYLVTQP